MNPLLQALEHSRANPPLKSPNFLMEIEGAPEDLRFFVLECTVSVGSLEIEEVSSGSVRFGLPRNATVSRLELTIRLDEAGKVLKYFQDWRYQVVKPNGTFGIPFARAGGYVRIVSISALDAAYQLAFPIRQMQLYPESLGQLNFSAKQAEALEMQVTLVQFMPQFKLGNN